MGQSKASKIPVLIASSLKPLKDTRAWEKLGVSLSETNTYDLNIIGFLSKISETISGIHTFPSMVGNSTKWKRLFSQVRFAKILISVKPKILIVCTYEYLILAKILKRFFNYKLVYDVQENYNLNLQLNPELSGFQVSLAKKIIQLSESKKGIDFYFLAEECYKNEMPEKRPFLILENKFAGEIIPRKPFNYKEKTSFHFLISGTISPTFGTLDGIRFFNTILSEFPDSKLEIMGHVPLKSFEERLKKEAKSNPKIHLKISPNPVDHALILGAIKQADFCLLPYQNHQAFRDKMPTKLFECMALGTPVLCSENEKWESFLKKYQGGGSMNFDSLEDSKSQFFDLLNTDFFTKIPDKEILRSSQEKEYLSTISALIQ